MTEMKKIRRLILHHAEFDFKDWPIVKQNSPIGDITNGIASIIKEVDDWHRKRWVTGLGYHFIVGNGHGIPDGYVAIGRPMKYQGAHVKRHNHDSVGILVMGNLVEHEPTDAQIAGVASICATLCFVFDLDPLGEYSRRRFGKKQEGMVISGHNDWSGHETNACPGSLSDYLSGIRVETQSLLFSRMMALPYTP
jgi:hypothetical protein